MGGLTSLQQPCAHEHTCTSCHEIFIYIKLCYENNKSSYPQGSSKKNISSTMSGSLGMQGTLATDVHSTNERLCRPQLLGSTRCSSKCLRRAIRSRSKILEWEDGVESYQYVLITYSSFIALSRMAVSRIIMFPTRLV